MYAYNGGNEVSIPQGTIKSHQTCTHTTEATRFQFHKVRLKDRERTRGRHFKNLFQFHKVRLKVFDVKAVRNLDTEFQFHKVRLKDSQMYERQLGDTVSIPQGTIKRGSDIRKFTRERRFQFHKVRLKVCVFRSGFYPYWPFQFHKVRLKVLVDV